MVVAEVVFIVISVLSSLTLVLYIPCRMYNTYLSRVLDAIELNMELEATEGVEKIVTDMLIQLLRLSVYIHKLGRVCKSKTMCIKHQN